MLLFVYFIQYCFFRYPSDSTVPKDAGIEPTTIATVALAVRHYHSAISHPLHSTLSHPTRLYLIHIFLIRCLYMLYSFSSSFLGRLPYDFFLFCLFVFYWLLSLYLFLVFSLIFFFKGNIFLSSFFGNYLTATKTQIQLNSYLLKLNIPLPNPEYDLGQNIFMFQK
jgi:hypothetical protein